MAERVIIIGSGPAGLAAAIYTAREGFNPLVLAGSTGGGQLELTTVVENMPGFPEGVNGPDLVAMMHRQAEKFGTRFVAEDVTGVDFSSRPLKVKTDGKAYEANSVVIATGASAKWLGLESEKKFIGKGVSSCGTCDGPFFKGRDVVVVGGGDTCMEDSLFLTRFVNSVTIVHRRGQFRASKIMQERVLSNPKIKVMWNSVVQEIKGESSVKSVVIKDVQTNGSKELQVQGVFIAIGYQPNTSAFKGSLKMDDLGYLVTRDEVLTDIDGVFVAGDVADRFYRQAATASGAGVKAALRVRDYVSKLEYEKKLI